MFHANLHRVIRAIESTQDTLIEALDIRTIVTELYLWFLLDLNMLIYLTASTFLNSELLQIATCTCKKKVLS